MKILILPCVLFSSLIALGQKATKQYHLKEIGMTINIPKEFYPKTKLPEFYLGSDFKPITDSLELKELQKVNEIQGNDIVLLELETKNKLNEISILLTPLTSSFIQIIGDTTNFVDFVKSGMITTAKGTTEKFDTLFSKIIIGNISFDKLFIRMKIHDTFFFQGGYFARLKNNYLLIGAQFDLSKRDQIMNAIETATFN